MCRAKEKRWYLETPLIDKETNENPDLKNEKEREAAEGHMNLDTSNAALINGELVTANVGERDGDKCTAAQMEPATSSSK